MAKTRCTPGQPLLRFPYSMPYGFLPYSLSLACWLVASALGLLQAEDSDTDTAGRPPLVREIFVPFEDLSLLLEGQAERVFLTREEYEQLLDRAAQSPADQAPQAVLPLAAAYQVAIAAGRATIRGTIEIEVLEPGLHRLPLELGGVGVLSAAVDGRPAPLASGDDGQVWLFVEGRARRRLELQLVTALTTSAAQQSLSFQVPMPPATQFSLEVPGNVEIRSGAAVSSRSVDEQSGLTRFELAPRRGPLELVMSLNNRLLRQQSVVAARGVIVDEVTQAYERLHATFSMDVLHGAVDRFFFRLPRNFAVSQVSTPLLARWEVLDTDAGQRRLEVVLREPTSELAVINIAATNNSVQPESWTMPRLEAEDVHSQVAVIGLLLEDRLAANSVRADKLISIDTQALRAALPESVFQADPGAPRVRPVVAYYAAQPSYELSARFEKPPAEVSVTSNLLLIVGDTQQTVQARFVLQPQHEKLFAADIRIPSGWSVTGVALDDGTDLAFERFQAAGAADWRIQVRLPQGIAPGELASLVLRARFTSAAWVGNWTQHDLDFPLFQVENATSQQGAIAIQTEDDLQARPVQLTGLTPLDQEESTEFGLDQLPVKLAYRFQDQAYAAQCSIERVPARITARTFSFFRLEPQGLSAYYEISYDINRASTRTLSLSLPDTTPAALSIRGLGQVQVKEFNSRLADGRRIWSVELVNRHRGQHRLAVDFQQPFADEEPRGYVLPLIQADSVAYQTSVASIEGAAEFDVALRTNGRPIDVGELVDTNYQVGRRLLAVYESAGERLSVDVDVFRRPGYGLPAALVQRAELVTLLSTGGRCQTAARYQLRTKAAYLQVVLPDEATLWSAAVDGTPSTPQREQSSLLLSLPPAAGNPLRDVQLVYELPVARVTFVGRLATSAPRLVVRSEADAPGYDVPTADVQWHLVLPAGHQLLREGGSVFRERPTRVSPAAVVGAVLYELAGGMGSRLAPTSSAGFVTGSRLESKSAPATTAEEDDLAGLPAGDGGLGGGAGGAEGEQAPQRQDLAEMADLDAFQAPADEPAQPDSEPQAVMPDPFSTAAPSELPAAANDKYWALEGVRSLRIALDRQGSGVTFRSIGGAPALEVTMIQASRLQFMGWLLALLIVLGGLLLTRANALVKVRYVIGAMALSLALPVLVGWLDDLDLHASFDPAFYAACWLAPYYACYALLRWLGSGLSWIFTRVARLAAAGLLLSLGLLSASSSAVAQHDRSVEPVDLLQLIDRPPPIELPADAIIIPYDADAASPTVAAKKVLVPYSQYVTLWNRAYPDRPIGATLPPAPYALAGARYRTTLRGEDHLLLQGQMEFDVYEDQTVEIPLRLQGGVLTAATLDGESARIRMVTAATEPPRQRQPEAEPAHPLVVVYATGKGRRQFEFSIRVPLQRSGGWRIARAQLPAAPSTAVSLSVPAAQTEVRWTGVPDRAAYETSQPDQTIDSALGAGGRLSLQWRPKVAVGQVDRTLTANSTAVFDIQEDGHRLTWQVKLSFRRSQRETFTVSVPAAYLVERVTGDNVRGWQSRPQNGIQLLEITLLKAATGTESFSVVLSHHEPLAGGAPKEVQVPVVTIPDAALHQGALAVRRSPLLEVRTQQATGLSRADAGDETTAQLLRNIPDESPLGIRPFQSFRFVSAPFTLRLAVRPFAPQVSAQVQSLVKIAQRETVYEARIQLEIKDRPLFRIRGFLPPGLKLDEVVAPEPYEWSVTESGERQMLTIQLQAAQQGAVAVVIRGQLPPQAVNRPVAVPKFELLDAARQAGYVVVQADPAYDVRAEELRNCESVLLRRVYDWLDDGQRQLARLALHYRSTDFEANLRTTARQPRVDGFTITNVRVTPREVQETIFLQYTILDAGIGEVTFQLPAALRDARISVPLLRQKTVTPVEGDPGRVRVRLELQDDVIDQMIVVVQHDRPLTGELQQAPIPTAETGQFAQQFLVLESAGRDEVVVEATDGMRELRRSQEDWRKLHAVLRSRITRAFLVNDSQPAPALRFRTKARSTVATAGARIQLSETLLIVDGHGTYRARQTYSVDNKTEQFLELLLPAGALLWTARVAGQTVKPTQVPGASDDRSVRIPLIKTAAGDLDYRVELKYGGRLSGLGGFQPVEFPLIRTKNINVEQSQVRLRLPDTHRWFNFAGTMRLVSESDLLADFVDYKTRQIQELRQVLNSGANEFSKVRARNNLKQLGQTLGSYRASSRAVPNQRLSRSLLKNSGAWQAAERELQQNAQGLDDESVSDNRDRLVELGRSQVFNRSTNVVNQLDSNFAADEQQAQSAEGKAKYFNQQWLAGNQLENARQAQTTEGSSRLRGRQAAPQQELSKNSLRFLQEQMKTPANLPAQRGQALLGAELKMTKPSSGLKQQVELYERKLQLQQQEQSQLATDSESENRQRSTSPRPPDRGFAAGRASGEPFAGTAVTGQRGLAPPSVSQQDAGLFSLDVELAERGTEYLFTTPRGEIAITARAVRAPQVDRILQLAAIVAALCAAWVCLRCIQLVNRRLSTKFRAAILIVLGCASLLGVFPVLGLLAIGFGIYLLIREAIANQNVVFT